MLVKLCGQGQQGYDKFFNALDLFIDDLISEIHEYADHAEKGIPNHNSFNIFPSGIFKTNTANKKEIRTPTNGAIINVPNNASAISLALSINVISVHSVFPSESGLLHFGHGVIVGWPKFEPQNPPAFISKSSVVLQNGHLGWNGFCRSKKAAV